MYKWVESIPSAAALLGSCVHSGVGVVHCVGSTPQPSLWELSWVCKAKKKRKERGRRSDRDP